MITSPPPHFFSETEESSGRYAALAILAEASREEISAGLTKIAGAADYVEVRPPETGLVMVRGRIGGDGAPFNLGEATVTRAAVRLASGETGFSYVLGRDHEKARQIAVCDALYKRHGDRTILKRNVLDPISERTAAARKISAEQTAATQVEFFTLVRGEP